VIILNIKKIREDFPILKRKIKGKPLIYLDNAATTQKPIQVINAIKEYYEKYNANIHRAIHTLGEEATEKYEEAREKIRRFINAKSTKEIIFVRNATEAINLVMYSWALNNLKRNDEIISTIMEHHSNIVPWQFLRDRIGIKLNFLDIDDQGFLRLDHLNKIISKKTKLIAITHASNVLGTINPIKEIVRIAHENGSLVLVDGAQSVPHMKVDVKELDCDFLVFSGHKMLGPMGIGVLYCKEEILESIQPFLYGGDMIKCVSLEKSEWNDLPLRFEAGTSNVEGAIGLGAAIDYLNKIGLENVREHDANLTKYALEKLSNISDVEIYGPKNANKKTGLIAFNFNNVHPHDVSHILDDEGIEIRSGHHCAMPLHKRLGIESSARISFYIYNTKEEIDKFIEALKNIKKILKI